MAKRGQGEGTISKRPDGAWWARITAGRDAQGRQKRKALYGKTRKEVQEKLTAALNEVNTGTYIELSKMTVEQWMEVWDRDYKKNILKIKTTMSYEFYIAVDIILFVGTHKRCELRADILQKFVNDLLQKGLKPSTTERTFIILKSAMAIRICKGAGRTLRNWKKSAWR